MILLTTNPAKYTELASQLAIAGIKVEVPADPLLEVQGCTLEATCQQKARHAARSAGRAVLVDDSGLELEAWPGFPGPLTRQVLTLLGREGLGALTARSSRARMVCVIGWSDGNDVRTWSGAVDGELDLRRAVDLAGPGPLASWFVTSAGPIAHRRRALEALSSDLAWRRGAGP